MKTFSKILLGMFLTVSMLCFLAPGAIAQGPICDQDVPFVSLLPHPNSADPQYEAEFDYLYRPTEYKHLTCGSNKVDSVDPCDPWVLTYYIAFWEQGNDQVVVLPPVWNWDTTVCQDVRFEIVYPANYVQGTYYDSVVMKTTMIPHATDTCLIAPWYDCLNDPGPQGLIAPDCWIRCMHERISYEAIDSCEVPNSGICRVEWDKPLPVELAAFTSIVMNNDVILNWRTSLEENNSGFYVERYDNGMWKELGFVVGKGNSTTNTDYTYTDRDLNTGLYNYRLRQVDFNGNFEYLDLNGMVAIGSPDKFTLSQNYPNPFNPTTTIVYGVPTSGPVTLKVFDNLGREVRTLVNEPKTEGFYTVTFSAPDLSSGVYFYKLESGSFVSVKRMVLMK
jgi:hypothetical protein